MNKIHAAITAVNGYVPDYIMTNKELETIVETSDEWITSRTGIKERRVLKGEGLGTSDMAVEAVNGLLKKRGIGAEEIELIYFLYHYTRLPISSISKCFGRQNRCKKRMGLRFAGRMFRIYIWIINRRTVYRVGKT